MAQADRGNGVGPLSLRCPARHSPHSEVGGEQPHGRCGLQFPQLSQPRPASPQGPRRPPEGVPGSSCTWALRTPSRPPGPQREGVQARPSSTAPQGGRALGTGTRLDGSCSGSWGRERPHPARPAHCLGFPPLHQGAPGSRQAAFALPQTPGPYLHRGSDCGSELPGDPRPASCGRLLPGRR